MNFIILNISDKIINKKLSRGYVDFCQSSKKYSQQCVQTIIEYKISPDNINVEIGIYKVGSFGRGTRQ